MARGHLFLATAFAIGLPHGTLLAQQVKCPIFQEEPPGGTHEIGVNLFSWIHIDLNNRTNQSSDRLFMTGLLYKLHCGKNAWRVGVDLFSERYVRGIPLGPGGAYPDGHGYQEGGIKDARFRVGYQRSFGKGKVKPFVGMDIGFRYVTEKYDFEGQGDFIYNPSWGTVRKTTEQPFLAPLIGLSYRPTKRWSCTVEVAFTFVKGRSRTESTQRSYLTPDEHTYSYSQDAQGLILDPLRTVAVSYHF